MMEHYHAIHGREMSDEARAFVEQVIREMEGQDQ